MTKFQVQFEGDDKSLLFRNPQHLADKIEPGHQLKQELLVVPTNIPFALININVQYCIGRQFPDFTVYLPNSLLKYMVPHEINAARFNEAYERHLSSEYRTAPFPLCRDFEPMKLKKILPNLI